MTRAGSVFVCVLITASAGCDRLNGLLFPVDKGIDWSEHYCAATVGDIFWQADARYVGAQHPVLGEPTRLGFGASVHSPAGVSQTLYILVSGFSGVGTYPLNGESVATFSHYHASGSFEFRLSPGDTGFVVVTELDWNERTVSGHFAFTAHETSQDSVLTVTDGTFRSVHFSDDD